MNSKATFKAACVALWGPQYQSHAARGLGIARSSLVRYDSGERDIPDVLMDKVYGLLSKRRSEIDKLMPKVRGGREVSS